MYTSYTVYPTGSSSASSSYSSVSSASYSSNSSVSSYSSSASSSASSSTPVPACPTMPDTGVTRTYDFEVAYQTIAPDGIERNGLTINGQFPGPLVEANWGDWILIKAKNSLTNEGTAIHAHGLFQKATPWYDGVPAVAQCPLVPNGGTLDMLFRADRYGSSWYHSHYSGQYSGGAHGPMVIHGPKHAEYDIDIGPILLEDWFHADYYSLVEGVMAGSFPLSNNNLINGKMQYPCANTTLPCNPNAGISKFRFQSGKKHLLRLVNTGAEGTQKFSIDGHTLTVVALDFVPVEPYTTNVVTLAIAQRADVIVEATGEAGDAFWMRSQLGTGRCTLNDGISPNAVAAVYYEDADTESVPSTSSDVTAEQLARCLNDPLDTTQPLCQESVVEPETTEDINLEFKSNGTNFLWYVNNSSYRGDYNQPILIQAKNGDLDFEPQWNVHNFGTNKTVRLHIINHGQAGGHPMHLHGHDYQVLAEGYGEWDGTIVNAANPIRRDTHLLDNAQSPDVPAYIVIQYTQDNPGVWPLHCHLAWHVSGGLFMNALERPDDILTQDFDQDIFDGCTAWDAYTATNIPNQIDSGL
ncbi:laccase-1 precursor [Clohesyomyces aquaticus]|uniref:Laccase-1 n=1 Tax=Clohesyomyces aquaticus TaxID=1231657 RepID=A0A1Y1ZII5_9PLEO|nr:laccase-1 precursor [Clohesyomyces aquaticus]